MPIIRANQRATIIVNKFLAGQTRTRIINVMGIIIELMLFGRLFFFPPTSVTVSGRIRRWNHGTWATTNYELLYRISGPSQPTHLIPY